MAVAVFSRRWKVKPPPGAGLDRSNPLASGLLAQYLFNESGGNVLFDSATGLYGGINNIPTDITWGMGRTGLTLVSSLTASSTTGVSVFGLPSLTAFTVEMWIYPTASDYYGTLFSRGAFSGLWYRSGSNTVSYYYSNADHVSTATAPFNAWTHFVLTQDAAGAWAMYFNGTLDVSGTGGLAIVFDSVFNDTGSETFAGSMDLLRLWNRPLSVGEIQALYADPFRVIAPIRTLRLVSADAGGPVSKTSSDSGAGTDGTAGINFSSSDSGAGSEPAAMALTGVDAATTADTSSAVGVIHFEIGVSADLASSTGAASSTESGAGLEGSAVGLLSNQIGTGADLAGPMTATLAATELGSELEAVTVGLSNVETAGLTETTVAAQTVFSSDPASEADSTAGPIVLSSDLGIETEVSSSTSSLTSVDTAGLTDTGTVGTGTSSVASADAASGADTAVVSASASETAGLADVITRTALTAAESSTGVETASSTSILSSTDAAIGIDTTTLGISSTENLAMAETVGFLPMVSAEPASMAESQRNLLSGVDAGIAGDLAVLLLTGNEPAVGQDSTVPLRVASLDGAVATDTALLAVLFSSAESAVFSQLQSLSAGMDLFDSETATAGNWLTSITLTSTDLIYIQSMMEDRTLNMGRE